MPTLVDDESSIGANLERAIEAAGYTYAQVGEAIGVTAGAIHSWCKGRTAIKLSVASKLADKLGITLDFLTGRSEAGERLSSNARAWIEVGRIIQEEGVESVAARLETKPEYARVVAVSVPNKTGVNNAKD